MNVCIHTHVRTHTRARTHTHTRAYMRTRTPASAQGNVQLSAALEPAPAREVAYDAGAGADALAAALVGAIRDAEGAYHASIGRSVHMCARARVCVSDVCDCD